MRFHDAGILQSAALSMVLATVLTASTARADDKIYVMKISTSTINDTPHLVSKNLGAAIERDSGGRIKAEIYPASQLGPIPRTIEGTQFGSIQAVVLPPEFFVGIDQRFEIMAAPALIGSMQQGQRVAADPAVRKLILGLGAQKGLHGAGLYIAQQQNVISRTPIRHLADFRGRKIRILASDFQSEALKRLGATPVAMTLGDVLPALQQGTIDGSIIGPTVMVNMHLGDAAKYATMINQPAIFIVIEISRSWYESLPKDLQEIVDRDAAAESIAINPVSVEANAAAEKTWVDHGGELIKLPPEEEAEMLRMLASVGDDVSKNKPAVSEAYRIVQDAAKRAQ
jgi:TRAP-type C4-dicarboxylate transport system substrate-binding protein